MQPEISCDSCNAMQSLTFSVLCRGLDKRCLQTSAN